MNAGAAEALSLRRNDFSECGAPMNAYAIYALKRLIQFALVVFIGINLTYLITHATPIDPVEQTIAAATAFGSTSPEAIDDDAQVAARALRASKAVPGRQYVVFWKRILVGDFGPSLSAFPTPVSTLIGRALPWTVGLLFVSTILAFVLGNLLGGLAGYYRNSRILKVAGIAGDGGASDPVLHRRLRAADRVRLSLAGAADLRRLPHEHRHGAGTRTFILSVLRHAILPVTSLVLVGIGGWFMGMRSLVSNVVTEDYVTYAELAGRQPRQDPRRLRDAQRAGAAGDRACDVARLDLQRRDHHRAGVRLSGHRHAADLGRAHRRLQPGASASRRSRSSRCRSRC